MLQGMPTGSAAGGDRRRETRRIRPEPRVSRDGKDGGRMGRQGAASFPGDATEVLSGQQSQGGQHPAEIRAGDTCVSEVGHWGLRAGRFTGCLTRKGRSSQ